jgi:hypothetical protein
MRGRNGEAESAQRSDGQRPAIAGSDDAACAQERRRCGNDGFERVEPSAEQQQSDCEADGRCD